MDESIPIKRVAFYFNSEVCSGCKTCQIACKDKNNLGKGIHWRRVYEITAGYWEKDGDAWRPNILAYNISMACNHCENPICMHACPTKAIAKEENGIVTIDPDKCIGCKYCAWTCPYSALQFDEASGLMTKCDMCHDYVAEGKRPSCVDACPTRALDFGEYDELVAKYGETEHLHPLPDQKVTRPSMLIRPHKDALKELNNTAKISNLEEIKDESDA